MKELSTPASGDIAWRAYCGARTFTIGARTWFLARAAARQRLAVEGCPQDVVEEHLLVLLENP